MYEEDCVFCRIAAKKEPASVVYEDEEVVSFMDIRPVNIGHVLVIPKKHYKDLLEMPEKDIGNLFRKVRKIALKVKKTTGADGISILQSNGKAAFQHVFHMHVHIIPRFEKDKATDAFVSLMKPLLKRPRLAELDDVAEKIKNI